MFIPDDVPDSPASIFFFSPLSILRTQQWLTACGSNGRSFACPGASPSWSVSICFLFFLWRLSAANRLLGEDLAGNTFWEFKDVMNAARFRRIVRFDPKTHFSDVQVTREFRQKIQARAIPGQRGMRQLNHN